jgi:thiosulfate reductase/polysulfide reductase chain A
MSGHALTRRSFLVGSAGVAAVAAGAGLVSLSVRGEADADAETDKRTEVVHSLCNSCSSKCGYYAYVVDGKLTKLIGDEAHPNAQGKLCARGYGYSQIAYSPDRLTDPMKKNENGEFEVIGWDQALSEIGQKVNDIIAQYGPEALAMVQDPRPSGKYYTKRFMNALGSPNVYTHAAACNLSKESGIQEATGAQNFSVDFPNTKMVVFIGRSYGDGIRPSSVKSLAGAAEGGARVVIVDPRLNNTGVFATDWVPIRPGADIAFLLGIANVLVTRDLYDHAFVEQSAVGFPEFAAQVTEYTPEWAEGICDVPADTIVEIAESLAAAAPACAIEPSWRAAFGCAYQNSFETARAVCAVNALLGCWGQKGGALITSSPKVGDVDPVKFPEVPKPAAKRLGDAEYPLALSGTGTNLAVLNGCADGVIQGVFFYNSNAVQGYAQPAKWREALSQAKLVVTIDVQMSETALASDYVLPECTVLERLELPEFIGGKKHYVALRTPIIERIHPETRPCDEIFTALAEACGVGQYFPFTVEELADAQLASVGTSLDAVREAGIVELADPGFAFGTPTFKTPTEKFQFASAKVAEAGLNPVIGYVPRLVEPAEGEFFLIGGKQGIHSHTMTLNLEALNAISREYQLERLWMAASDAADLGIADGDTVELSSSECSGQVAVKVTERLKPGVLFLPTHYGGTSPYLTRAQGFGLNMMDFVPLHLEPGVGSTMSQEVAVKVRKVEG